MFNIKAPERFPADIVLVGQGRKQTLKLVFKAMPRTEYTALLDDIKDGRKDAADGLLELIESWEADMPLSKESLSLLEEHQPGAQWALVTGYGQALVVTRQGN